MVDKCYCLACFYCAVLAAEVVSNIFAFNGMKKKGGVSFAEEIIYFL